MAGAQVQAPPGHPGQPAVLIACAYASQPVSIDAPDPDLQARVAPGAAGRSSVLRLPAYDYERARGG